MTFHVFHVSPNYSYDTISRPSEHTQTLDLFPPRSSSTGVAGRPVIFSICPTRSLNEYGLIATFKQRKFQHGGCK